MIRIPVFLTKRIGGGKRVEINYWGNTVKKILS